MVQGRRAGGSRNSTRVLELFREIHAHSGATLIVVTHDEEVAAAAARRFRMEDGRLAAC